MGHLSKKARFAFIVVLIVFWEVVFDAFIFHPWTTLWTSSGVQKENADGIFVTPLFLIFRHRTGLTL